MRVLRTLGLGLTTALLIGAAPAGGGVGAGHVFGDEAMARFCQRAQQVVGGTDLVSDNVLQPTVEAFIGSDAAPWDDDDGRDLPLTTQQFTTVVPHPTEDRDLAAVVSCKMKSAEGLQYHYGSDAGELGRFCQDVHAEVLDAVFGALTPPERARLVYTRDDVVLDLDTITWGGPDWTTPFPPQVAYAGPTGALHLRAKALIVPRVFPVPVVGPEKRAVHYCHVAAPDLVRELVTGDVTAGPLDPQAR